MRVPKILTTLQQYDAGQFMADVIAGVTVAMVALPLSLAIAIASGADPSAGLVTAVVAGFLISALGGSRVQIGGPTGAFIVVVFSIIADHGYDGLVLATLMAGALLVVAGLLRAGRLIALVPEAVVNGFTIGIAVIIATSQIKDFLGLTLEHAPADLVETVASLAASFGTVNPAAVGVAVLALGLIIGLRRLAPRFPGLIVALAVASGLVALFALPVDTIAARFGALPTGLPVPAMPAVSLAPSAVVIAFLAGVESLLSAMVADRMTGGQHRPNAELTAQGVANIGSALFGGLPATGAIARTATNIRAGGLTPVSGLVHALVILAVMLVAAPLAGQLALPALSALLMVTAWNMSEPHRWGAYWRAPPSDRVLLVLTLGLTIFVDLAVAIGVGVAAGFVLRWRRRTASGSDWSAPER